MQLMRQARCDADSRRRPLPAGSDVDLLHTTVAMWQRVISEGRP